MSTVKQTKSSKSPVTDDSRRNALLEAAVGVFIRYGFRKTSMDEVAKAAQISRQGLYLYFSNKEDLFRATIEHTMSTSLAAVTQAMESPVASVEEKLVNAYDAWAGPYVGKWGADAADLLEAAETLMGDCICGAEARILSTVTETLRTAKLPAGYKSAHLSAAQLAENLHMTVIGLKHHCDTREEFVAGLRLAVKILFTAKA